MPTYIPLHDRPPYFYGLSGSNLTTSLPSPRYASPDLDPDEPYPWTRRGQQMSLEQEEYADGEASELPVSMQSSGNIDNEEWYGQDQGNGYAGSEQQAGPSRKRPRTEHEDRSSNTHQRSYQPERARDIPIIPSIFGISPRNEFTKTVGEFIMAHCRGQENVEVGLASLGR